LHGGDGSAGEFGRDVAGDAGEAENLDVERCSGIPGRLQVLLRIVRQSELELPARHRLTNCIVLPFELVSNGRADEVSTIGVEAVADHEIHVSEIDEAEKAWPHSSSVIALTFRVETPCTYISASVATSACSER